MSLITRPPASYTPPTTDEERISDPYWRLNNLYTGIDEHGRQFKFTMRPQQHDFFWRMWYLSLILKSRQHGFTTLLCLAGLDRSMFIPHYHCHFIQQTQQDSFDTFEKKIKTPYDKAMEDFPELRQAGFRVEVDTDNNRILKLANGSTISTGTSGRGGTNQFLHISEYGKICAEQPAKAREIRSGALNTVHPGNFICIESTAEGRTGDFYTETMNAKARDEKGVELTKLDFKFFFYAWHDDRKNVLDPRTVAITAEDKKYFKELKTSHKITLTPGQKAWYVKKKEQQRDLMYREHPSTPEESFQGVHEQKTYGKILIKLRKNAQVQPYLPFEPALPVNTSWDLGKNDHNAIWLHQFIRHRGVHRWLWFHEDNLLGLSDYWAWLKEMREEHGFFFGKHYLPHDVEVSEQSMAKGETRKDYLEDMGMRDIVVVDRVPNLTDGLAATRQILAVSEFSEHGCKDGLVHLEEYEAFEFDEKNEANKHSASKHRHSHAADAIRQLAQGYEPDTAYRSRKKEKRPNYRTA